MRKAQKKQAEDLAEILCRAHGGIKKLLEIRDFATAMTLLEQCQQGAIRLGEIIEQAEGEGAAVVSRLEDYCELIYRVHEETGKNSSADAEEIYQMLQNSMTCIANSIQSDIEGRLEAVFLPYKASLWGFLESVWEAAKADLSCDTYVIPIPYYYKNLNGSFQELQYDGDRFPDNVPITKYDEFNFEWHRPDMIFIQSPYDEYNHAISVHPFFYSRNLKKYTEELIYIPPFILDEINADDERAIINMENYVRMPGVVNADKVIVQSESMRQTYIDFLVKAAGESTREVWQSKILGLDSSKPGKKMLSRVETMDMPAEWITALKKPDGTRKTAILYSTSVSVLLQYGEQYLEKLRTVFEVFRTKQDETVLWWHPQPLSLIGEALNPRHSALYEEYEKLVRKFCAEKWGIYDESSIEERAAAVCDAYFGDGGSVPRLFLRQQKPVLIQNVSQLS